MKEHLFENRIANVRDGAGEYQAVVFKNSCANYEIGRCYLLTRDELELLPMSGGEQSYIIDRSLQGLVDEVRRARKTVFSREELEGILGVCWVTQESLLNLHEPVLVDDGNICEKDGIILCQEHRGGFAVSTQLMNPDKRLSVMIPHPIIPLISADADLVAIDQTKSSSVSPVRVVTFMEFLDEAITRKTREITPNHPGLIKFRELIHDELYHNMPHLITTKEGQLRFFSSPEFQKIWNKYRRDFVAIKQYGHYVKYINGVDLWVLPGLAALICPSVSSLALEMLSKCSVAVGVYWMRPTANITDFLYSHFFRPDLSGDGLDLTPFLEAMRKNIRETRGADHPFVDHPHLA